jgi:hypothetical protein
MKKSKNFLNPVKNSDFISIRKKQYCKAFIMSIAIGMQQAKEASGGKIKSRSAKTFLNEL